MGVRDPQGNLSRSDERCHNLCKEAALTKKIVMFFFSVAKNVNVTQ